ncbi:MAG: hypothetical protein HOQ24_16690, partial [Mycobacteriaceae bacterium]|nr:hypothetical protein [Mycobacteriaceae bacterium]
LLLAAGGSDGGSDNPSPAAAPGAPTSAADTSSATTTNSRPAKPKATDMQAVLAALPPQLRDHSSCKVNKNQQPSDPIINAFCTITPGDPLIAGVFKYTPSSYNFLAEINPRSRSKAESLKQNYPGNVYESGTKVAEINDKDSDTVFVEWYDTDSFLNVQIAPIFSSRQNAITFLQRVGFEGGAATTTATGPAKPNDVAAVAAALPDTLRDKVDCRDSNDPPSAARKFKCGPKPGSGFMKGLTRIGLPFIEAWIDPNATAEAAGWRANPTELVADRGPVVIKARRGMRTWTVSYLNADTGLRFDAIDISSEANVQSFLSQAGLK